MKISVAICTYNGEKYINEQIDSILNQTLKVDEIIVCDDRSTDKTIPILNKYSETKPNLFKINQNEINLRSVKNFEKAINLCSGDIIFLSDQDDIWVLNKVEEYIKYFNENPEIDVLASNGFCIDENSNIHSQYAIWDVPEFLREKKIEFDYHTLIAFVSNIATGASMAFRKKIIPEIMPFPIIKDFHHDEWIALIASEKKMFSLLNEKYFYYRIHSNQQVGGVFFDKTNIVKNSLTEIFNLYNNNIKFINYKKKLKKLCVAYSRQNLLYEATQNESEKIFKQNLLEIEKIFNEVKAEMINKYFVKSYLLNISDKILKKRILKK